MFVKNQKRTGCGKRKSGSSRYPDKEENRHKRGEQKKEEKLGSLSQLLDPAQLGWRPFIVETKSPKSVSTSGMDQKLLRRLGVDEKSPCLKVATGKKKQ